MRGKAYFYSYLSFPKEDISFDVIIWKWEEGRTRKTLVSLKKPKQNKTSLGNCEVGKNGRERVNFVNGSFFILYFERVYHIPFSSTDSFYVQPLLVAGWQLFSVSQTLF